VKGCRCIESSNRALASEGIQIDALISMRGFPSRAQIRTVQRADSPPKKRGWRPPLLAATFCPFCGKEYPS
jgi:hypothetical protein